MRQLAVRQANAFDFKHITTFHRDDFTKPVPRTQSRSLRLSLRPRSSCAHLLWQGPCVLFATPGMLHAGTSLEAFKYWAPDPRNLLIIPGYCVVGTVGSRMTSGFKGAS